MTQYQFLKSKNGREFLWLAVVILIYEFLCYKFILLKSPLHGDEHHFYKTVLHFSQDFSLKTLYSYNELITPLTFLVYGVWAKLINTTDLHYIRELSLIIGATTHLIAFCFLKNFFRGWLLWLLFFIWLFNPYNIGLNALIYTDGLSNLFTAIFLFAFFKKRYFIVFIVSALLIYIRQYNVILILAAGLSTLIFFRKIPNSWKMLIALFFGIIAIIPLFIFWNGTSPNGAMTGKLNDVPFIFYAEALPVYVYCIFIYSLPVSLLVPYRELTLKNILLISVCAAVFYLFFPVKASLIAVKDGFETVGLFDKLLDKTFAFFPVLKHFAFYIFAVFGCFILFLFYKKYCAKEGSKNFYNIFLLIYIVLFLVAMMFNFQIWEKYFLQILLPVLVITGKLAQDNLPKLTQRFQRFRDSKT